MRKITSLLMLFCAFVGSAWAQLPTITTDVDHPVYYTIYNTRSSQPGGLMYFAGENVGIKDGCTSLSIEDKYKFFFTGSHDALYVHNAATGLKLATVGSWTETGAEWQVIVREDGNLAFGQKGAGNNEQKWWNEKNYATNAETSDFTSWTSGDAGSAFVIEPAESHIFPETDKFYVIECPLFFSKQGIQKGLYVNGEGALGWNTVDLTNKNYYWVPTVNNDGTVTLKNLGTGKYLNGTEMSEVGTNATLNYLGSKNFNISSNNVTIHANGHNNGSGASGNIVNWGGVIGSASAWMFVEKTNPDAVQQVTVNYSFVYGGEEKYHQETVTLVGEEYPAFTIEFPYGVSAVKPAGVIEAGDVVDGTVTKTIELAVNLPFVPAADYASIQNWYYLKFHATLKNYLYYDSSLTYIDASKTAVDAGNKDAYTWAFIGNPFDGFKVVNKLAGADMILSSATEPTADKEYPVMTSTSAISGNTYWDLSASTYGTNGFFMAYDGTNKRLNKQDNKLCYWLTGADAGSTFMVEERDMTGRAELQALVEAVEAANYTGSDVIGYYTESSVNAVNDAVTAAKTALAGELTAEVAAQHQVAINNAVAALVVNMPTPGAYYRLKNHLRNMYVSVDATGTRIQSAENNAHPSLIWTIEQNGETYKIKNLNHGENGYMKAPGGGNDLVDAASAASYTLRPLGDGQFNLVSGSNLVIYSSGELGAWGDNPKDSDGAWYFEPATELEVVVTSAGYATLYLPFDVTLPNTVKAYAVETVHDGSVTLTEKADIPANTGAILEGEGNHTLTIAAATSDWSANKLAGTNVNTYVEGNSYVLGVDGEGASLFLAELNKDGEGAEGTTHFLNNANKAYLPVSTGSATQVLRFNFGETTGIESTIAGENGNAIIFDLSGRRVNKMQKGVYIVNGKKVYVK